MSNSFLCRIQNTLKKPIKEKIFFLHIPKCGGNSIKDSLKNQFISLDLRKDNVYAYINTNVSGNVAALLNDEKSQEFCVQADCSLRLPEYLLMYYMSQPKIKCIAGHVPFCEIAYRNFKDKYAYITIMRDPVDRWISEFFYNKNYSCMTSNMDIHEYMTSDFGKAQGTQYVLFLGGRSNGNDHYSSKAVKRAIDNLNNFSVIGFLENLNEFAEKFHQRFGISLDIGQKNVTPLNQDRNEITDEMRQQIETICERDLEIYHKAQKMAL